MELTDNFKW